MDFTTFEKVASGKNSEEGIVARFYDRAVKTGVLSADGLPKFKNVCFCEVRIKDNMSEIYDQPADEDKIKRFPVEYARYKQAKKETENGTPLEQFAFLNAAEIESLKLRGIFTVEALSELSDDKVEELELVDEKSLAIKFIKRARGTLTLSVWQQQENEYKQKIKTLENKVDSLLQQLKGKNGYEKYSRNLSGRS